MLGLSDRNHHSLIRPYGSRLRSLAVPPGVRPANIFTYSVGPDYYFWRGISPFQSQKVSLHEANIVLEVCSVEPQYVLSCYKDMKE